MLPQFRSPRYPLSRRRTTRSRSSSWRLVDSGVLGGALILVCLLAGPQRPFAAEHRFAGTSEMMKSTSLATLYLEVQLGAKRKMSSLKRGDVVEGTLTRDVYSGDHKILPAGSRVRLTVSGLERRRRERSNYWPWIVKIFSPAHQNYPTFEWARVVLPGSTEIPLRVAVVSMNETTRVYPQKRPLARSLRARAGQQMAPFNRQKEAGRGLTLILKAAYPASAADVAGHNTSLPPLLSGPVTLPAGTKARVILLRRLSASKSDQGESFSALLVEPVRLHSRIILPEGSLFEGKVERRQRPRWLSRPGSIRIAFTGLILPSGAGSSVVASLAEADMDKRSRARMNAEGELSGGRPGLAWMLINSGVAAAIAKESDDTLQLVIEAIVSTATDASTAGVARIVAACTSGVFMVTRHGRDVILPRYTEMGIVLNRGLTLSAEHAVGGADNVGQ
jgi:hypothetical protein